MAERLDGCRNLGAPNPATRPERKIVAAVALMMAVRRAMAADEGAARDLDAFLADPVFA